ncbi:DUF6538 domain-containing protein [Shewanella sp. NIFS-20-20]|uniref:DUF6538 domain-containing protein n=1 Tax=Shewanella sp. NIFS-20-20 TaxID=2853806 RepID=UPI001C46D38A|nr:DUF6538 domain-containing protein [Shewanella sp. NIFS-20-20]MBV7316215.1 site-specific integrase [Shewanella sp. NIFS-20-20]
MSTNSKSANNRYLKLHHDTWVYCRRVPKDLKHLYPNKTNITISLKTSSVKAARIKRDKLNGELAAQLQGAYSPDRMQFKQYLEQVKPYVGALQANDSAIDFDDVLPRNDIAKAAFRQEVYGDNQHAYSYTLLEGLNSLLGRSSNATPDTVSKLRNATERFLLFLKARDIPLREIHKKQVVEYVDYLGQEYAHGTITAHLSRLKSVWVHAYKLGEIDQKISPFCDHDLSKYRGEGTQQKQLFSKHQLQQILRECPENIKNVVRLGLFTGARLNEICNAHEELIDGVRCMVIKKSKTASGVRVVPLPPQVDDITLPLCIETKTTGRAFSRFKVERITDDKTRSFHSLRVHYTTAAQRAKVEEFETATLVGHKAGQTMSYGYYAKSDVKKLLESATVIANQVEREWLVD